MYKLIALVVLLAASAVNGFWTPCGGSATTHEVYSSVCDQDRCHVVRGQSMIANTTITFVEPHPILTIRVTTVLFGITIPLPLPPPENDACLGIFRDGTVFNGCPVSVGRRYNWVMEINVPSSIPAFQNNIVYSELIIKNILSSHFDDCLRFLSAELVDHNNQVVSCSRLVATVV
jgi:hypothetical protein